MIVTFLPVDSPDSVSGSDGVDGVDGSIEQGCCGSSVGGAPFTRVGVGGGCSVGSAAAVSLAGTDVVFDLVRLATGSGEGWGGGSGGVVVRRGLVSSVGLSSPSLNTRGYIGMISPWGPGLANSTSA